MHSKKMTGRKCYDHLGGRLGAELFEFYLSQGWIVLDEGKSTVYVVTEKGYNEFKKIGLHIDRDMETINKEGGGKYAGNGAAD